MFCVFKHWINTVGKYYLEFMNDYLAIIMGIYTENAQAMR